MKDFLLSLFLFTLTCSLYAIEIEANQCLPTTDSNIPSPFSKIIESAEKVGIGIDQNYQCTDYYQDRMQLIEFSGLGGLMDKKPSISASGLSPEMSQLINDPCLRHFESYMLTLDPIIDDIYSYGGRTNFCRNKKVRDNINKLFKRIDSNKKISTCRPTNLLELFGNVDQFYTVEQKAIIYETLGKIWGREYEDEQIFKDLKNHPFATCSPDSKSIQTVKDNPNTLEDYDNLYSQFTQSYFLPEIEDHCIGEVFPLFDTYKTKCPVESRKFSKMYSFYLAVDPRAFAHVSTITNRELLINYRNIYNRMVLHPNSEDFKCSDPIFNYIKSMVLSKNTAKKFTDLVLNTNITISLTHHYRPETADKILAKIYTYNDEVLSKQIKPTHLCLFCTTERHKYGYAGFYDSDLDFIEISSSEWDTITHELGHAWDFSYLQKNPSLKKQWNNSVEHQTLTPISIREGIDTFNTCTKRKPEVSNYSQMNLYEYLAESIETYSQRVETPTTPSDLFLSRYVLRQGSTTPQPE